MLRHLIVIALAVTAGTASPMSLSGQAAPTRPAAGQRVRLHLVPPSGTVDGTVLGWVTDTLVLGPLRRGRSLPDTLMRVPRTSIVSYQPSLGPDRGRGFARGAKTGAIVGGTIGLAIFLVGVFRDVGGGPCHECLPIPASVVTAVFGAGALAGGILIGAVAGSAGAPDRWGAEERVTLREYPGSPRRFALVLSLGR
jgi:hypothetical protein